MNPIRLTVLILVFVAVFAAGYCTRSMRQPSPVKSIQNDADEFREGTKKLDDILTIPKRTDRP